MENISTTELRTKSSKLVESLRKGLTVNLVHRSKVVGSIQPAEAPHSYPNNKSEFETFLKEIKPTSKLSYAERSKRYAQHLKNKYGESIS
jgi:antitoxin (DNA-binding transcriptional repressor) of toxin-antitoxin stability system